MRTRQLAGFRSALAARRLAWTAIVALLLVLPCSVSTAQDGRVTVRVDGRALLRVGAADSTTSAERALRVERRLATLLEAPGALAPARVQRDGAGGADRVITVSGVPVITVTSSDAADNVTTPDALAGLWARAIDAALTRAAERRLSPGGRFGAEVQASVEAAFSRLLESAVRIVPRVLAAGLVLGLFGLLAALIRRLMRAVFRRVVDDLTVENLIKQLAYYAVWALGLFVAVDALGFQPETVVTGLGLTGLALGFALKDIISNFVSGMLILSLRPFQLGDQIVVGETEGSVERIQLRATEMRTYDGRLVLVPNADLFTSRVTNNTASPMRRAVVSLHLGYDSDLQRAAEAIRAATSGIDGVLADPPVAVRVGDLGPSDLRLEVRFWTDSRRADFTATQAAVRVGIVEALRLAGIGLPDSDVRVLLSPQPEPSLAAGRAARVSASDGDVAPPVGPTPAAR